MKPSPDTASGIAKTIAILSRTENEAATPILLASLDSPLRAIQEGALAAILLRRSLAGQREIIRRMDTISDRWREIIDAHRGRMTQAVRDALLDSDAEICRQGCAAATTFREYDLIPALVNATEDEANVHHDRAAATLLQLADLLYEELHAPRDYRLRRDPQLIRRNVTVSLEESVKRFNKHQRREPVEAFLLLAGRDNSTLMQILDEPRHPSYLAVIQALQQSTRLGIMRLILGYLDDAHAPSALVNVMAHRTDARFIELLLKKIGREPTAGARANLKHVMSISWLKDGPQALAGFDDAMQHSALQLVISSGLKNADQFTALQFLATHGTVGGRRAASEALVNFNGADANQLVVKCLQDPDPAVQAAALNLLRPRGIPGALATLIRYLDHDSTLVRRAAQQNLPEYNFGRFLAVFESLEESIRRTTGNLVLRVDPQAITLLRQELRSNSGKKRMRALGIARTMQVIQQIEPDIRESLADADHLVRVEAAYALSDCPTPSAREALEIALSCDTSLAVREAAQQSLIQLDHHSESPAVKLEESIHSGAGP